MSGEETETPWATEWETVLRTAFHHVSRLAVPGGWIVETNQINQGSILASASVFVPHPGEYNDRVTDVVARTVERCMAVARSHLDPALAESLEYHTRRAFDMETKDV